MRQLSDKKFYRQCSKNLTLEHHSKVQELVKELHDNQYISDQTYNFLSKGRKRTSVFYLLPKIHKNLTSPPGKTYCLKC